MSGRFTDEAQRASNNARMDASIFGSDKVEPEHLLLGILRENSNLVNRFLKSDSSPASIREDVLARMHINEPIVAKKLTISFADSTDRVFMRAAEEADRMHSEQIGIEHLLLALLQEGDCHAAQLLLKHGANPERTRNELIAFPHRTSSREEKKQIASEKVRRGLAALGTFPTLEADSNASGVYKRLTDKALFSIYFAKYEASQLGSPKIEPEHLLLGMLREEGTQMDLFLPLPDSRETITRQIKEHSVFRERIPMNLQIPLSIESHRVLANAVDEATKVGHERIRLAHLLLGLLREERCFAARLLQDQGVQIEHVRSKLANPPHQAGSGTQVGDE